MKKQIIGFGAGKCLENLYSQIRRHTKMKYVCDNDSSKWGKKIVGDIVCISPDELKKRNNNVVLILVENKKIAANIATQLNKLGVEHNFIYNTSYYCKYKIKQICKTRTKVDWFQFIYWNFISKQIDREKSTFIIPHKGTVLDIDKTAKIYLSGANAEFGGNKLRGSKAETLIRLGKNAKWFIKNGCYLFYDTVLEIKPDAVIENGFFSINSGGVIVCAKNIQIGEDVMMGRNIMIYDSDFHSVLNNEGEATNYFKRPVVIEDHVWLTNNIKVLKGSQIGSGSIVGSYLTVRKGIPSNSLIETVNSELKVIRENVTWSRTPIV